MVESLSADDFTGISGLLNSILSNDNEVRKQAEASLNQAKSANTDKYALVLAGSFHPN